MAHRESSSVWIFTILIAVGLMLGLSIVESDYTRKTSVLEAQKIELEMGASTLRRINALAGNWYRLTVSKVAALEGDPDSLYSDDPEQRAREERFTESLYGGNDKLNDWLDGRRDALLDLYYWVLRRVALFVILLPTWIPLAILATFHGLQEREIKKTDFGYTSPVKNHWARRVIALCVLLILLVFFAPIALDPLIFPLIMAAVTVAIGIAVGNIQKRI